MVRHLKRKEPILARDGLRRCIFSNPTPTPCQGCAPAITTATGLIVAIPAMTLFYVMQNRLKKAMTSVQEEVTVLMEDVPYDRIPADLVVAEETAPAPKTKSAKKPARKPAQAAPAPVPTPQPAAAAEAQTVPCPECSKDITVGVEKCPHCGTELKWA